MNQWQKNFKPILLMGQFPLPNGNHLEIQLGHIAAHIVWKLKLVYLYNLSCRIRIFSQNCGMCNSFKDKWQQITRTPHAPNSKHYLWSCKFDVSYHYLRNTIFIVWILAELQGGKHFKKVSWHVRACATANFKNGHH